MEQVVACQIVFSLPSMLLLAMSLGALSWIRLGRDDPVEPVPLERGDNTGKFPTLVAKIGRPESLKGLALDVLGV